MNDWITENFNELQRICRNISKQNQIDDLFQICVEQFLTNKKVPYIPEEQRLYFFTRLVRNNFNSKTSIYYKTYNRNRTEELFDVEIKEEDYVEDIIDMNWVQEQIEEMKKDEWYYSRLFELYLEEGASITKLSQRTTIPINSVSRDINKVRKILKDKRNKLLNR